MLGLGLGGYILTSFQIFGLGVVVFLNHLLWRLSREDSTLSSFCHQETWGLGRRILVDFEVEGLGDVLI